MGLSLGDVLKLETSSENEETSVYSITLFVALLCVCILIGHVLEKARWMNESIIALAIGLGTGFVLLLTAGGKNSHLSMFNEELFFIYLLPPIIFNAGFQIKKKRFFQNFITIVLLGAFGTVISFAVISIGTWLLFKGLNVGFLDEADYLALGAIFSATDSVCTLQVLDQDVTPFLYSLVFGEGVVNDATSVLLFNAIQRFDLSHITSSIVMELIGNFVYLFSTSTLLGIVVGLVSAYTIKKLYIGRHSTDRQVALMMLMAYLSYMMAELFNLSSILTVFFCGIVMSHYTWHNVTEKSRVTTKHAFATLSFIAEIFLFLYVGMDALDIEKWTIVSRSPGTSVGVSSILLGLVMIGRAATVFPLSLVSNMTKRSQNDRINFKQQIVVWWAGLMRGAVSMALAYNKFTRSGHTQLPGNAVMITSTITVVLFSTVVFGLLTKPLVQFLLRKPLEHSNNTPLEEEEDPKSLSLPLLPGNEDSEYEIHSNSFRQRSSLQMLLTHPTNTVHYSWRRFDNAFMRPVFGGRGFTPQLPESTSEESLR